MSFLALLLTLALSLAWDYGRALHRDGWYRRWRGQVAALGLRGVPAVLVLVGLPVIAVQLLLRELQPLVFGLGWIAAATLLLLYSLGRGKLNAESERYRSQCRRGDFEGALLYAQQSLGLAGQTPSLDSQPDVHRTLQTCFLYQAQQRWFAVLFYFLLLGPAGALAYRLLYLAAEEEPAAAMLLQYVDWVPGRLMAAAFTVTGNFVESADELAAGLLQAGMRTPAFLYSVAMAATGEDRVAVPIEGFGAFAARQNEAFMGLLRRSGTCWVVVIALLELLRQ